MRVADLQAASPRRWSPQLDLIWKGPGEPQLRSSVTSAAKEGGVGRLCWCLSWESGCLLLLWPPEDPGRASAERRRGQDSPGGRGNI